MHTIENLKWLMSHYKHNTVRLAELSGVPQSTISRMMGGIYKNPRHSTMQKLAKVYGLSVEDLSERILEEIAQKGKPLKMGEFENNPHLLVNKLVSLPPTEGRMINVDYVCELVIGEFKKASSISDLNKKLLCLPHECSDEAFAIVYVGTGMGEILDHGQPILLDKAVLIHGNQYILAKDGAFMLAVFESSSDFGQSFRKKGTRESIVLLPSQGYEVFSVISVRRPTDVING